MSDVKKTILLVEDDLPILKLTGLFLEAYKYEVLRAENGYDALEILKNQMVDIMITDIKMPIIDGITLVREIRASGNLMPILVLSAFAGKETMGAMAGYSVFGFVHKPYLPSELLAHIEAMFGKINPVENITSEGLNR